METTEKTLTKSQAIAATIGILMNVKVPMRYKQEIMEPLDAAISNLISLHRIMEDEENEADGPVELQIVKEEPAHEQTEHLPEAGKQPDPA